MSEANSDQPVVEQASAPGVAADAPAATTPTTTDDASTDHLDYVEAEDELEAARKARIASGDLQPGDDAGAEGGEAKPAAPADDSFVEVEDETGAKHKVPKALEGQFLRDRDYRQKTQALAEERRAVAAERETIQQQAEESRAALPEEYAKVAVASREVSQAEATLAEFEKIDWPTWRAQTMAMADDDPAKMQYRQYRTAYDAARETLADAQRELGTAKQDLSAKEQTRLTEQQQARETALAEARQQTGEALRAEGWDQQRLANVASFAATEFGVTAEELLNVTDPRTWRMADMVMNLRAEVAKLTDQLKKTTTADSNLKAQASRPAEPAKGNAQPTRPRDDNSTDSWMERRNRQVAAKLAAKAGSGRR